MGQKLNESWNVGSYDGRSNNAYTFRLEIIENSQSVVNNKTSITVNKYLKGINRYSWYGYRSTDAFSGSVSDSITYNPSSMSTGVEYLIHSYTTDIAHNADGTMTISVSNTFTPNGGYSSMPKANTKAFTVALTPIPRASQISLNTNSIVLNTEEGNAVSYTITPADSSYTHNIIWSLGGHSYTISNATSGSLTYGQLLDALTSSLSGTLSVKLETYSGSTKIGENTVTASVTVDSTVFKPIVALGTAILANTTPVTAATIRTYLIAGITTGKLLTRIRVPRGATKATAQYSISVGTLERTYDATTHDTGNIWITTGLLPESENDYTVRITIVATDSRGATVTYYREGTVYGYKKPIISLQAYRVATATSTTRDDGGAYAYVTFSSELGAVVNGYNSITSTTCTYSGSVSGTATDGVHIALADDQSVTFTCVAKDKVSSSTAKVSVSVMAFPLDLYDDLAGSIGVGIGTIAESGKFKCALPADMLDRKYRMYESVADIGLTIGSTTISAAWDALPNRSILITDGVGFASTEVPNSYCTIQIVKYSSSRGYILAYGKGEGQGDYRMYLASGNTPTGTWVSPIDTPTKSTTLANKNTTNYRLNGTAGTNYFYVVYGRLVFVTFNVYCVSAAQWPTACFQGLPAPLLSGADAVMACLGSQSINGGSIVAAIQANGDVQCTGGTTGQYYYGTAVYIKA